MGGGGRHARPAWWWPRSTRQRVDEAHSQLQTARREVEKAQGNREEVRQLYGPNKVTSRVAAAIRGEDG
jgi:hypothetical protein